MCYDEGTLQAYLDGAYEGDAQMLLQHLSTCSHCKQTYDQLKFQDLRISALLNDAFSEESAFASSTTCPLHISQGLETHPTPITFKRRIQNMHTSTKKWIAAAACVSLVASVFTFQPAMAESFLKMFRVNQIESVAISTQDLNDLEQAFSKGDGKFNLKDLITVDVKTDGKPLSLDRPTVEQLAAKMPELKPFGQDVLKLSYAQMEPAHNVTMTLDVPKINDVLVGLGETTKLPDALNKKPVVIHFKDAYNLSLSSNQENNQTYATLTQSTFPEVEIPDQINQDDFLKSLYAMNFLPDNLKKQFMSLDNPGSALPVPYNPDRQIKENLVVGNAKVLMIKEKDGDSLSFFFTLNNKLYALNTNAKQEQAINWIKELQ